jgi:pyridoxal phosphate enzyme (YggS family)
MTETSQAKRLAAVLNRIRAAELRFQRQPSSVTLLAVSKTKPVAEIAAVAEAGQQRFGENYLQEALDKIDALQTYNLEWHFIGPIQSNKTRRIAEEFDWVHSVDRFKIAQRLSEQRPGAMPPLNICLQINIDQEDSKSGFTMDELADIAPAVAGLSGLRLRGLMALPAPRQDFMEQRQPFALLREAQQKLITSGLTLDTLSMGMSDDLEAAIAEGSTIVRVGTAIFGPRSSP